VVYTAISIVVEISRSQCYLQNDTGNEDLIIVNAARSPFEMQTSLCYCNMIILTDSNVHQ